MRQGRARRVTELVNVLGAVDERRVGQRLEDRAERVLLALHAELHDERVVAARVVLEHGACAEVRAHTILVQLGLGDLIRVRDFDALGLQRRTRDIRNHELGHVAAGLLAREGPVHVQQIVPLREALDVELGDGRVLLERRIEQQQVVDGVVGGERGERDGAGCGRRAGLNVGGDGRRELDGRDIGVRAGWSGLRGLGLRGLRVQAATFLFGLIPVRRGHCDRLEARLKGCDGAALALSPTAIAATVGTWFSAFATYAAERVHGRVPGGVCWIVCINVTFVNITIIPASMAQEPLRYVIHNLMPSLISIRDLCSDQLACIAANTIPEATHSRHLRPISNPPPLAPALHSNILIKH